MKLFILTVIVGGRSRGVAFSMMASELSGGSIAMIVLEKVDSWAISVLGVRFIDQNH